MERKPKKPIDEGSWMNTYADMVTLLMCFFVLLFSMSTIDSVKWEMLVRSMNPNADKQSQIVNTDATSEGDQAMDTKGQGLMTDVKQFEDLYWQMKKVVEENNLQEEIQVSKAQDFTFITFRNNVFFDGDSDKLKPQGAQILDAFCLGIAKVSPEIGEIRVLGHTNQADPNHPNEVEGDRFLSSNRAVRVAVYMQKKNIIDPKKLVPLGYGQHYPIASFTTPEDRAKNRRVEILITKNKAAGIALEEVYQSVGISQPEVPAAQ